MASYTNPLNPFERLALATQNMVDSIRMSRVTTQELRELRQQSGRTTLCQEVSQRFGTGKTTLPSGW